MQHFDGFMPLMLLIQTIIWPLFFFTIYFYFLLFFPSWILTAQCFCYNLISLYQYILYACQYFVHVVSALRWCLQFLGNLRNLRDSHAALAVGSSETVAGEPSSVTRIISDCESALTFLNRDLGILSASIARERGEEVNLRWNCFFIFTSPGSLEHNLISESCIARFFDEWTLCSSKAGWSSWYFF